MEVIDKVDIQHGYKVEKTIDIYKGNDISKEYTITSVDEDKGTFTYSLDDQASLTTDTIKNNRPYYRRVDMNKVYPIQKEINFDFRCECGIVKHIPITVLKEVRQVRITGVKCDGCGIIRTFEAVFND